MLSRVWEDVVLPVQSKLFAAGYDRFLSQAERSHLTGLRRQTLQQASGDVLEIGAGTGLNLEHYPDGLKRLVLSEPDTEMVHQLRGKLSATDLDKVEVIQAPAEKLPFEEDTFDTVTMTMVLCSVLDPDQAVSEIARVLKPGGKLLFFEHVRSSNQLLAACQDFVQPGWGLFGKGCHGNRDTQAVVEASPLHIEEIKQDAVPWVPVNVRPLIVGTATAV